MAAYQCLNCKEIEHGDVDCCEKPDLFCINDMPDEILRLREGLRECVKYLEHDALRTLNDWRSTDLSNHAARDKLKRAKAYRDLTEA